MFRGLGVSNTDFYVAKTTRITERQTLLIRGEAFILFNHTNFLNPIGSIGSATFGRVAGALDPGSGADHRAVPVLMGESNRCRLPLKMRRASDWLTPQSARARACCSKTGRCHPRGK